MTDKDIVVNADDVVTETATKIEIDVEEYEALKADRAEKDTLKAHHAKVAEEKKQALAKAEKDKAEAEGDLKKLLELKESEIKERDDKLATYAQERVEQTVMDAARGVAQELAKSSPAKAALLAKELKARLVMTEDGIKVTDGKGKYLSDNIDTLKEYAKKEYDFLCDGLQSTGGAGVVVGKPTGAKNDKLDVVDRLNMAFGITE